MINWTCKKTKTNCFHQIESTFCTSWHHLSHRPTVHFSTLFLDIIFIMLFEIRFNAFYIGSATSKMYFYMFKFIWIFYPVVMSVTIADFHIKRCSVRLYLQLFVGGRMSYLRYLCLFAYSGVQHIMSCVFFIFVLCTLCCQFLFFLRLGYPMLPDSLDCPFLIDPWVLSNFHLNIMIYII